MIANFFIFLINKFFVILGELGNLAMAILPDSPMESINNLIIDQEFLTSMNWVVPFDFAVVVITLWIPALFLIYLIRIVLKWVKAL